MYIIGVSAYYHDSSACLFKDGELVFACEEEKFTGIKHDSSFPEKTIEYIFNHFDLKKSDIEAVCYYENPNKFISDNKASLADPFLTAKIGTAFVKGMQGNDANFLKTSATAKHYAVHSGPEATRDKFNAVVDEKDLRETYLYAFHSLVNAGVESVMSAYNSVNGVPSSINKKLLDTLNTSVIYFDNMDQYEFLTNRFTITQNKPK